MNHDRILRMRENRQLPVDETFSMMRQLWGRGKRGIPRGDTSWGTANLFWIFRASARSHGGSICLFLSGEVFWSRSYATASLVEQKSCSGYGQLTLLSEASDFMHGSLRSEKEQRSTSD